MTELHDAFVILEERGNTAGATTVVDRAINTASPTQRRATRVALSFAVAAALLVTSGVVYTRNKANDIERVDIGALAAEPDAAPDVMNVLLVGVDSPVGGGPGRADAIVVIRLTRTHGVTAMLAMPRDLYLTDEATKASDRLSTFGPDPERLVRIVETTTGLSINHYAQVDYSGFGRIVDATGGITIHTDSALKDALSGLDIPAGCVRLDADQALAYVRSRHLMTVGVDGRTHVDPTGDLGRISRLQALLITALQQLGATRDIRTATRLLDIAADTATVDRSFKLGDVVKRLRENAEHPHSITSLVFPSTPTQLPNGAAVLEPVTSELASVISAYNADPVAQQPPGLTSEEAPC